MISKIGVEDRNQNNTYSSRRNIKDPSFKSGGGVLSLAIRGIQECEKNPMINVAVVDMLSAILPRTFVESITNWFAGFEAFRRESSGLIVNCLIPSFITMGVASILNKFIMPKNTNMAGCWADSSLIKQAADYYTNSDKPDKVKDSLKKIIENISGFDGSKDPQKFKDILTKEEIEHYSQKLRELTESNKSNKDIKKSIKEISTEIIKKTHIAENIKVKGTTGDVKASTVNSLLEDSVKFFKEFRKAGKEINMQEFAQKSRRLVKSKSILGLGIVLPLAISMQYINRWITSKISGVKGAPIYEDFGKNTKDEASEKVAQKATEGLLKQKIISISSMLGVSLLSMMKMPSWNMIEFKGMFPTMDQARIISTGTFASRMAAAEDKNELAEATVRDIATFASLYFLGDYAAKATATIIQKKMGITLLNETKKLDKDANILRKFWHWVKDINIKSSDEVVSKTEESLKKAGKKITVEDKKIIEKEIKKAVNLRSACQAANLGVSLILLGLVIPIFTRSNTKKKHAEALKLAEEQSSSNKTAAAPAAERTSSKEVYNKAS